MVRKIVRESIGVLLLVVAGFRAEGFERTVVAEENSKVERFRVVQIVSGLENPWGLAFLPEGSLLVTERVGREKLSTAQQPL